MAKRALVAETLPTPGGAYSHISQLGALTFTAGFGPQDPRTGEIPDGVEEQTVATLANVQHALQAVGLDLVDVVKATVHLAHLDRDFAAFNHVYSQVMPEPYPVRTTVGSQLLGILVEIDVVAGHDVQ